MSDFQTRFATAPATADMSVDAGLRAFMLGVYNKVALGLVLSAALAFLTSSFPPVRDLLFQVTPNGRFGGFTLIGMIVAFAPLAIILFSSFAMRNPSPASSGAIYWTIVSLIGASMGALVFRYTGESIGMTFLITAAAFGGLSLFGYTTKRDLTALGSFLIIGLFGLILASVATMIASAMSVTVNPIVFFIINVIGALIFAGLIAYDTQRLKMTYYALNQDQQGLAVATNYGALSLYLDFINLFQFLLAIFGGRR